MEKALYKLVQTKNRKMKIRLNLRKYVLPIKIRLKKRVRGIIIWDQTKLKEIQQVALFSRLVKPRKASTS